MLKGDIYKVKGQEKFFQMVGYWGEDLVLAPMGEEEKQVLIYSSNEMREFINSGYFSRLHPINKE